MVYFADPLYLRARACKEPGISKDNSLHVSMVWEMLATKVSGIGSFLSKLLVNRLDDNVLTSAEVANRESI